MAVDDSHTPFSTKSNDVPDSSKVFKFASGVPLFEEDSERVKAIKMGLNAYFAAVSLQGVDRPTKLKAIGDTFSKTAELITPSGLTLWNEKVVSFYDSDESPVMKDPHFCPQVNVDTMCISADGNTIAVEICLTSTIKVGDWFSFDEDAKICRMRIYS
jgi:hypothetical protein